MRVERRFMILSSLGRIIGNLKDGLMKMATCNVHIMDGHLMGVAPKFLRLCLKALKLVQSSLQELNLPDFLQWCPKVCSLFGQMRMAGKELKPPTPPFDRSFLIPIFDL
uniref:Uncharacterized protein n=1 Tax=Salix viminalis TaxID=40686 RepID=A0A6N2L6C0_SALVM